MATADKNILEVERRELTGKGAAGRLRRSGAVPGSVYGMDRPPFSVTVKFRRIDEVLHLSSGRNTVLTLTMPGTDQKREVMIRALQRDPITSRVTHVDFVRVDPNVAVTVNVPIQLLGEAEGVKNEGGILDFVHRVVSVSCLPAAIPEHLDIDISELHLNQHVSVSDIVTAEGIEVLDDESMILAVISATKIEEEPTDEEEGEVTAEDAEKQEDGKDEAAAE
jgi:large subunit ribosomal protein L25